MEWLGRQILKLINKANSSSVGMGTVSELSSCTNDIQFGPALEIVVFNATGGKIIRCRHYDHSGEGCNNPPKDRPKDTTYVIDSSTELVDAISKIVMTEEMKK